MFIIYVLNVFMSCMLKKYLFVIFEITHNIVDLNEKNIFKGFPDEWKFIKCIERFAIKFYMDKKKFYYEIKLNIIPLIQNRKKYILNLPYRSA